jgi:hypothetical protein
LHQRTEGLVCFLLAEDVKGPEIHVLYAQFGDSALPQQNTYEWVGMFKKCKTSTTDSE